MQEAADYPPTVTPADQILNRRGGQGCDSGRPPLVFLFTGIGSNYIGMGRGLYDREPVFRSAIEECAEAAAPYLEQPLLAALYPKDHPSDSRFEQAGLLSQRNYYLSGQFAVQVALARLWIARGVQPDYLLGHSIGEYSAAVIAGIFTIQDAMRLGNAFSRLLVERRIRGSMAAVFADSDVIEAVLAPYDGRVAVIADNGPKSVVIAGDDETMPAALDDLKRRGLRARLLGVDELVHSPLVAPILDDFDRELEQVRLQPARVGFASTVLGRVIAPQEAAQLAYWRKHLSQPVRFADAIRDLGRRGADVFLEIGPNPALLVLGRHCLSKDYTAAWLPSLNRGQDDHQVFLESLAAAQACLAGPPSEAVQLAPQPAAAAPERQLSTQAQALLQAAPAERVALFYHQGMRMIADVTGDELQAAIGPEQSLVELGIDSLMVVELRNRFRLAYGIDVPLVAVFSFVTVGDLFSYLLSLVLSGASFQAEAHARTPGREEIDL